LKVHLHHLSKIKSHKEGLLRKLVRKSEIVCDFFYSHQCHSLHCFIFLVSVIGVISFNILDSNLKFSGKNLKLTVHLVKMNTVRIRISQNEADPAGSGFATLTVILLLEKFSTLKCCAGEIAQLQSEISHSERLREAMAVEMTKLTEKAEQVRTTCDLQIQYVQTAGPFPISYTCTVSGSI
jgi:hypothetical protein